MKTEDKIQVRVNPKGQKKVKCHLFNYKTLNRQLAVHEHLDDKNMTSISDPITGCELCKINEPLVNVTNNSIHEALNNFISHYTVELIQEKFKEWEEKIAKEKK